ncbi:hypothetical protein [Massilia sp. Se16.2.3]|uniref:hypothetical protein n=1 Tax=Massilia sp. Se16.2.3 TaxID=2709303 RepID=UPI001E2E5C88|nr:hypothetical protein [Massilia sp. Se16.2.3]
MLLHSEGGAPLIEAVQSDPAHGVPGRVIPMALHHTASTGIDVWLAALSYGAAGVTVLMTGAEAPQYAGAIARQMEVAQTVLEGLGYAGPHFQFLQVATPEELGLALQHAPRGQAPAEMATFNLAQTSATRSTTRSTICTATRRRRSRRWRCPPARLSVRSP